MAKKRKPTKKTQTLLPKLKKRVRLKSLNPQYQPRVRKELVDFDYINKLNPETKEWLAQFVDESIGASVRKLKSGKIAAGQLHNTEALAKECYDANNRRNNDVYSVTKANGLLYDIKQKLQMEETDIHVNYHLTEEAAIAMMENDEQDILSFQEFIDLKGNLNPEIREFYVKYYSKELREYFKGLMK